MATPAATMGVASKEIDFSARLEEWRRQLLDTSKRSRLINTKFGRGGILAIEHPHLFPLWERLAIQSEPAEFPWPSRWIDVEGTEDVDRKSEPEPRSVKGILTTSQLQSIKQSPDLGDHCLLTNLSDRPLDSRLKRLSITASTSLSEQGVNSLFMAFGFLRWFESAESDVPILSPLVLLPVAVRKESADSTWDLSPLDDDLASNHPLDELFRSEFRLTLPQFQEEQLWESTESLRAFFAEVEHAVASHERWQLQLTAGLGTFAFQKISMWQDLRKNETQIINHPMCRGIAGDSSLMPATDASEILDSDLDKLVPPETSCLVRDCDGSQLAAMEVVQRGHSLILDGPPGTGKSQTITNIIARSLADNKTVLFVSEKAAALEVVKRRLDEAKLGDFCLECHSHKANKRAVIEELGRSLNREVETYPSQDHKLTELRRTRQRLNEYVRALHVKRSALNLSAFAVHGRLARIRTSSVTRVPITDIHLVDRNRLQEMEEAVARLAGCGTIIASKGIHPWRGSRSELYSLTLTDEIRFHFDRAAGRLRQRIDAAGPLQKLGFLRTSPTCDDVAAAVDVASATLSYPRIPASWVDAGLAQTAGRYIALLELSQNYRILWSSIPVYKGDAHLKTDPSLGAAASAGSIELKLRLRALPAFVRKQLEYLKRVDDACQSVMGTAEKLDRTGNRLRESLGLPDTTTLTSASMEKLAADSVLVANLGRVKIQWFDSTARTRLRQIASTAREIAAIAIVTRSPLDARFLPTAFSPIASDQINDVLKHRSWLRRIGASWRRAKQSFCALYKDRPPTKSPQIVDDAFQLQRLHRYTAQLGSTAAGDQEELGWDGSLQFDWDSLLLRFQAIERLPSDLQNAQTLQSIATSPKAEDRAELLSVARAAQEVLATSSAVLAQLLEIAGGSTAFATGDLAHIPVGTLKIQATELQAAVREQIARCNAISPLITEEQDAAVEALANDFAALSELRSLKAHDEEIASALGETLPESDSRSLGDWLDRARLAEWVQAFVKQHGGAPPLHIVRAISDDAIRAELSSTVKRVNATDDPASKESLHCVESLFNRTEPVSTGIVLSQAPISEIIEWLSMRARDADRMSEWVGYTNACANLRRVTLEPLLEEILDGRVRPDEALDVFRQRFHRLWLDEAYRSEPGLGEFDPAQHDQTASHFRSVDRFWVTNGFAQVRSRVLAHTARAHGSDGDAPDNSELGILLREVHKRKRHLPLRRLFAAIPSLLPKLKPCMMMSPLAVSTYFDNSDVRFDVVIFDEASQVRPHDAICAIYRGSQLVVAGDQKQLPPTNFFERLGNEDESEDDELETNSNDYESILDMCATLRLPRQRLKWHYRSKRESLIAFSNQHFYGGELVTFPSVRDVDGSSGVEFCFVENGRWAGGSGAGLNQAEAEQIAEAVIRHASERPDKSLGVITMNQAQQMHVMELIEHRRRAALHLEEFFSHEKPDPFFVKNLENVQGDERDVVFLGVGYARNEAGTLSHNFGPLNRQGGERRLNVAITRAREALTLFTSIRADDIDLSRTQARGAKLLRAYLDFAERGKAALAAAETEDSERDFDSDFEAEVARALIERGLDVHRQIGCSGYRIDLALMHPAHPGRYVLGVECDGATYHKSATARDRDRLRQDVLESLGWKICRIWSTDWIRDPRRQLQKVLTAYQEALTTNDSPPPPVNEPDILMPSKEKGPARNVAEVSPHFANIDEVPAELLRRILFECIESFGAMPPDDLAQAAARKLGFQRTGSRIRDRVAREFQYLKQRGQLAVGDDGRLRSQNGNLNA